MPAPAPRPTGGLPSYVAGYIYITLHLDVWFLLLTVGGGLVCFVTVGGVYVYAVECMTMCKGYSPHYLKRMCACFWEPVYFLGGQPVALYVGALISHLVGWESTHLSVCHPRPGSAAGGSGEP